MNSKTKRSSEGFGDAARVSPGRLGNWVDWIGYAAAAWSLAYAALSLYWTLGGAGFPFGIENDPKAVASILGGVRAETAAPIMAALALVGAAVAATMATTQQRHGQLYVPSLLFAWVAAVALALVIPDYRVLVAAGYAPVYLAGAPFGWPPGSFLEVVPWPVINQYVCIVGGLLWTATAIAYGRRASGSCPYCGRGDAVAGWTMPESAARWGRWAVSVAVIIPVLYAVTRWAWAFGIPLGISEEFLREGQEIGLWWAGAALATIAIGGAILTLGLVQRWGEVFPRWVPSLSGKRVPMWLAIVPASLVSVLVTTAGLMFVRLQIVGAFGGLGVGGWAAIGPELLWPLWGVALGASTLAYYFRRRTACGRCGRG